MKPRKREHPADLIELQPFLAEKKVSHMTPFPRILGVFRPGVLTENSRVLHFYGRLRDSYHKLLYVI